MNLNKALKVYRRDLGAIYEAAQAVTDWRPHSWYNAATGTFASEPTQELDVSNPGLSWPAFTACTQVVLSCLQEYCAELMPLGQVNAFSPVRLNRYKVGTIMRPHVDHIHSLFDGASKGIPVLSIVANLNDGYTGGEFIMRGEVIPLAAGDVLIFPSCFLYPHEVAEVTSGTRYSFVSWAW